MFRSFLTNFSQTRDDDAQLLSLQFDTSLNDMDRSGSAHSVDGGGGMTLTGQGLPILWVGEGRGLENVELVQSLSYVV